MAIFRRTRKFALAVFILFAIAPFFAFSNQSSLRLHAAKKSYAGDEVVRIAVVNLAERPRFFYVDLEVIENGVWVGWPFRMEDGATEAGSFIRKLKKKASCGLVFDIKKVSLPPVPAGQKPKNALELIFRAKLTELSSANGHKLGEVFSPAFTINKPFEAIERAQRHKPSVEEAVPHPDCP